MSILEGGEFNSELQCHFPAANLILTMDKPNIAPKSAGLTQCGYEEVSANRSCPDSECGRNTKVIEQAIPTILVVDDHEKILEEEGHEIL